MNETLTPPPLSACYRAGASWFKNELLPNEGARFNFKADFASLDPSSGLTILHPAPPQSVKPPVRRLSRLIDVLSAVMPSWTLSTLNSAAGFAGLGITECDVLYGQARMRHLIALQKLWDTDTSVSRVLRDLIDGGACLLAFGSIFWSTKGGKEGLCVPAAFRLSATDRRIVLCYRPVNDDLCPNDYALGASLNLKHF